MADGELRQRGREEFEAVMGFPAPQTGSPYTAEGAVDFVFGQVWTRPGLTRKERRWITLTCVAVSGSPVAIQTHVRAALATGDICAAEFDEFVLHLACYAGWPVAATVEQAGSQARTELGL